jgi:hypothetical protein
MYDVFQVSTIWFIDKLLRLQEVTSIISTTKCKIRYVRNYIRSLLSFFLTTTTIYLPPYSLYNNWAVFEMTSVYIYMMLTLW